MSEKKDLSRGVSRRRFIASTAAAAVTASLANRAKGQTSYPPKTPTPNTGPWTRVSLTDPAAPAMLDSYRTAITALLALSPTDGRNFYRNAMVHLFDCPHGNWWFPPWHRGYLGWWEQTVRKYSGNPNFAFPYWDWTAQPFVPDAFWQGTLNPANAAFISDSNVFNTTYTPAVNAYFGGLTPAQKALTALRGVPTAADFMQAAVGQWFDPTPRVLTQANPNFDPSVAQTVSIATIESALATPYYAGGGVNPPGGFGSDIVPQHYGGGQASKGILESQPHDNVHGEVGGFMGAFLSPVDPIFMAHHSNIDRIWTIWTAQQQAAGQPTTPTGSELTKWEQEAFLFYFNVDGNQVSPSTSGDYTNIGNFNYTYTKGSGAPSGAGRESARASADSVRRVAGTVKSKDMNISKAAVAQVSLPRGTASREGSAPTRVRAHITIQPPPNPMGVRYHVFVNPPESQALDANHPSYAGTIQFFGVMKHAHPETFTVPLDDALSDLRNAGALKSDQLNIVVVPQTRGVALRALPQTSVTKVEITTY